MSIQSARTLSWDWHPGTIPDNVVYDETAYLETSYSFLLCRSEAPTAVRIGRATSIYLGVMFDLGPRGQVSLGDFCLLNGARIICDSEITIGDYCLISWNVVLIDSYRMPLDTLQRREELESVPLREPRRASAEFPARPIRVERNVWIGFDCCILPGVTIGEGSIVGARSVVAEDVPPFTVVAGNPARAIRHLQRDEPAGADPSTLQRFDALPFNDSTI
jgi:acetyltransferase-like isoleucine patch superfamily enzyme